MSWISSKEYNSEEICPICQAPLGIVKGIYKTDCGHIFHNDCLLGWCNKEGITALCPLCREELGYNCMDVYAFNQHILRNTDGSSLFNGNQQILDIYNNDNKLPQGGRKHKRGKKTKKRQIKKRISRKNKIYKKTKYIKK